MTTLTNGNSAKVLSCDIGERGIPNFPALSSDQTGLTQCDNHIANREIDLVVCQNVVDKPSVLRHIKHGGVCNIARWRRKLSGMPLPVAIHIDPFRGDSADALPGG